MIPTSSERARAARLGLRAAELFGHRAASSSWRENTRAVLEILRAARAPAQALPGDVPLVIVLLAWRRRMNLALQTHLALATPGVERVLVSNNDPSRALVELVGVDDPRLCRIEQPRPSGPVTRYQVAHADPGRFFVALDDDLFLSPRQLAELGRELSLDPAVPHGFYGQLRRDGGFQDNVARSSGEVDILNRGYAFSQAHLARYFELLEILGVRSDAELRALDDDLVLSFASSRRPRIHDLGPFGDCPSEHRRGALWRRREAPMLREELYVRLQALVPRGSVEAQARKGPRIRSPRSLPVVLGVSALRLLADAHHAMRIRL